MAYQIHDDFLGIWGTEKKIGKSIKGDISQKKKTLPVIYGLENSSGKDKQRIEKLYSQESIEGENIAEVVEILNRLGTRNYVQKLEQQYYYQALAKLEATSLESFKKAPLREIAYFLVNRDY